MIYITINPGSSSIKYALFDTTKAQTESFLGRGKIARISEDSVIHSKATATGAEQKQTLLSKNLSDWLSIIAADIQSYNASVFTLIIRVVHDGGQYNGPVKADKTVLAELQSLVSLAPLHLPQTLEVIRELQRLFDAEIWLVFDTHFHQTMPQVAQTTGLPKSLINASSSQEGLIRRYGFHGLSHQFVRDEITRRDGSDHAIISCHLGGGSSICAIENGTSIQTSMGFGPGTGLMMGSRAGDVDWEALLYCMQANNLSPQVARSILYTKSGIRGMTEGRTDLMPEVLADMENPVNQEVIEQYIYDIVMTIGSYTPLFQSPLTHLVFTGGIGSGSYQIRQRVMDYFSKQGWRLDRGYNQEAGEVSRYEEIQTTDSNIKIIALQTDEEAIMVGEIKKKRG
jgi:acetate kinase